MNTFDPSRIIEDLSAKFRLINGKYTEMMNIMTNLIDTPEEDKERCMIKAAHLWHDIKQDHIFLEMVYEKNKDAVVRESFKQLDQLYELVKNYERRNADQTKQV